MLKKAFTCGMRQMKCCRTGAESFPSRLWRIGRTDDAKFFVRELKQDNSDFVVDVLIDASGSQRSRQGQVAMQAYILSEALSNVNISPQGDEFLHFLGLYDHAPFPRL